VVDNVLQWLRDFHVDALRLDAVHALHDDDRAMSFLEELSGTVDGLAEDLGRPLWLIAESDRNDPRTVLPRTRVGSLGGGSGIDAQ
jgi:maltooligosyltrehalose trehalohydrolase